MSLTKVSYPMIAGSIGVENVGIGENVFAVLTSGSSNTALGFNAGAGITTSYGNVAVGDRALAAVVTTGGNVAVGAAALLVATNERNTAIGNGALITTTTGTNVIGIGDGVAASSATASNEATIGNNNLTNFRVPGVNFSAISGAITFTGVKILVGPGTPEGAQAAPVGSLCLRTDGGANTTLYVKESGTGNTGWVAK